LKNPVIRLSIFIKLLFILIPILLGLSIYILGLIKYEGFLNWLEHKYSHEKIARITSQYLSPYTFQKVYYSLIFLWLIITIFLLLSWNKINLWAYKIHQLFIELKQIFINFKIDLWSLKFYEKILLIVFFSSVVAVRFFYLFKYPLMYDEVFSYMHSVDKGFLVSILYYPGPNNHIFFSILCVINDLIIDDPFLVMRLPSLLVSLLTIILFYACIRRVFNFSIAFLAAVIMAFSYNLFFYSIHGRGYALISFFFVLLIYSGWKVIDLKDCKSIYKLCFLVGSVLGMYTVPTFLYAYLPMVILGVGYFFIKWQWSKLKSFLILQCVVGFILLLFYGPVLFLNGMEKVTGNNWVAPINTDYFWSSIVEYMASIGSYFWSLEKIGVFISCLVIVVGIFILYKIKLIKIAIGIALFFIIPLAMVCVQKVLPPPRVWDYLFILLSLLLSVSINQLLKSIEGNRIRIILLSLLFILLFYIHLLQIRMVVSKGFPYYSSLSNFLNKLFIDRPERVYVHDDTFKLFIEFTAREMHTPIVIDTIENHKNDVVILNRQEEFPAKFNKTEYDEYINNAILKSYVKNK
jgi:hypothetical protein